MKKRFLYRSDGAAFGALPASRKRLIDWLEKIPEGTPVRVSVPGFSTVGKRGWSRHNGTVEHEKEELQKLMDAARSQRGLFIVEAEVLP